MGEAPKYSGVERPLLDSSDSAQLGQSQTLSPCNRQRLRLIIHKHSSLKQSESRRPAKHARPSSSATTQVTVSVVCVPGVRMSDKKSCYSNGSLSPHRSGACYRVGAKTRRRLK